LSSGGEKLERESEDSKCQARGYASGHVSPTARYTFSYRRCPAPPCLDHFPPPVSCRRFLERSNQRAKITSKVSLSFPPPLSEVAWVVLSFGETFFPFVRPGAEPISAGLACFPFFLDPKKSSRTVPFPSLLPFSFFSPSS